MKTRGRLEEENTSQYGMAKKAFSIIKFIM